MTSVRVESIFFIKRTLPMLTNIAILLSLQILGEVIAFAFSLPIPGPVIGMVLMLLALILKDDLIDRIRPTASVLLAHLALLFVPAAVGVIQYVDRIQQEWVGIVLIIVLGTAITMVITAVCVQWIMKLLKVNDEDIF